MMSSNAPGTLGGSNMITEVKALGRCSIYLCFISSLRRKQGRLLIAS